jgi:hypothetical protein
VISRITSVSVRSRGLLLLPVGAYVVHQLRYRIAYGSHAGAQLAAQGHSYLDSFAPWLVLLLGLAVGSFLARLAQAATTGRSAPQRSLAGLWAAATVGLVGIYAVQELLEGFFAAGHPGGLAGIFGHGGWWAAVVAVVVGAAIALVLRAADAAVEAVATTRRRVARVDVVAVVRRLARGTPPPSPLASAHAGRGPPGAVA